MAVILLEISELEGKKAPRGEVTLVGAGRLGLRTALNLMQIHRGGPERINVIDGQRVSADDLIFRLMGATPGEYKVKFIESLATLLLKNGEWAPRVHRQDNSTSSGRCLSVVRLQVVIPAC